MLRLHVVFVAALSALTALADVEIHLGKGKTVSEAFEEAASARGLDDETNIVILVEKSIALNRSIFVDKVLCDSGSGKLTIRGVDDHGKRPRIMGSLPVRGWQRTKGKFNGRSDVWEADISDFELSMQLGSMFCDGKMMTLCRYPNFNPKAPYAGGWAYCRGRWLSMYDFPKNNPYNNREIPVFDKDWHDWKKPLEGRVVIFPRQRFGSTYCRISELDRENKKIVVNRLCDQARPGDTYIVSGFREELDAPGEWYHDLDEQKLYFIPPPGVKPDKALITIPTIEAIFEIKGAHNFAIENLELCAAAEGIKTSGCAHLSIRGCQIHDIERSAVLLDWGHDNELRDSDIFNIGGQGVHITGGGPSQPNTVENCWFHHIGMLTHCSNAIFMEGHGYRVVHNLFHDLTHWAVFHTGGQHMLTDNRVHHYMTETEDGAAFYTCNANGNVGTHIARNWISDGIGFAKGAGWGPLGFFQNAHGLYFDSGPNHGFIYDNVIERASGMAIKVDSNNNQVFSNNVYYCTGRPELLYWSYAMNLSGAGKKNGVYEQGVAFSNQFVRSIWYYPNCPHQIYCLQQGGANPADNTFDYNWICPGKDAKYPRFRGYQWKEDWTRKMNLDEHSVVMDNLGFKDPKNGDFTPKNHQLMMKLGIHPLVMKKCGLYVNEFRKKIEKEPEGAKDHPEWFSNPKDHVNPPPEKKMSDSKKK